MTDPHPTDPPMHRPLARSRAPRRFPGWAMAAIVAAPLICLLAGLVMTAGALRDTAGLKPAIGTVASISRRHQPEGPFLYRANIRYSNEDGEELEGAIGDWAAFSLYDIGDEVAILYTDADPTVLRHETPAFRYGVGPYLSAFGAVLLGVVLWFRAEVARQPSPHWFGPPALPEGAPQLPQNVRRDRPAGGWLARLGRSVPEWVWWTVMAIFSLFVLLGIWLFADTLVFLEGAEKARGEVVAVGVAPGIGGRASYFVTIRYRDGDDEERVGKTTIRFAAHDIAPGEEVEIYFSPDRPDRVRIADFFSLWFPGVFFTLFGGLIIVLVVWLRDKARSVVEADWERDEVLFRPQEAAAAQRTGARRNPANPPPAQAPASTVRR